MIQLRVIYYDNYYLEIWCLVIIMIISYVDKIKERDRIYYLFLFPDTYALTIS